VTIEAQRAAVVAEAMTWLGTPWRHQGRVKGAGVDCAQFVIACYRNAGLIPDIDAGNYPRDWHIHKSEERFLSFVPSFAAEIGEADARAGDLVIFRIGRVYSHGAIIVAWPQGIHAAIQARQVVLCDLDRDAGLITAQRKYFTFEGWLDGR
jgi:cell wall-associated NlpC family hydrolase